MMKAKGAGDGQSVPGAEEGRGCWKNCGRNHHSTERLAGLATERLMVSVFKSYVDCSGCGFRGRLDPHDERQRLGKGLCDLEGRPGRSARRPDWKAALEGRPGQAGLEGWPGTMAMDLPMAMAVAMAMAMAMVEVIV